MNKNRKFPREISRKKICDEIIINLLSTDITHSRWGLRWVLKNDENIIGPNVYKAIVEAKSIISIDALNEDVLDLFNTLNNKINHLKIGRASCRERV